MSCTSSYFTNAPGVNSQNGENARNLIDNSEYIIYNIIKNFTLIVKLFFKNYNRNINAASNCEKPNFKLDVRLVENIIAFFSQFIKIDLSKNRFTDKPRKTCRSSIRFDNLEQFQTKKHILIVKKLKKNLFESIDNMSQKILNEFKEMLRNFNEKVKCKMQSFFDDGHLIRIQNKLQKKMRKMKAKNLPSRRSSLASSICSLEYAKNVIEVLQQNYKKDAETFFKNVENQFSTSFTRSDFGFIESTQNKSRKFLNRLNCFFDCKAKSALMLDPKACQKAWKILGYFDIKSQKQMKQIQFKAMNKNYDGAAILKNIINKATKNIKVTKSMCRFLKKQFPANSMLIQYWVTDLTDGGLDSHFSKLKNLGRECLSICRTGSDHLFGCHFAKPFDPQNQKNRILSLTDRTVYTSENNPRGHLRDFLRNLGMSSESTCSENTEMTVLDLAGNKIAIYKTRTGQLMGKCSFGQNDNQAQGQTKNECQNKFTIKAFALFCIKLKII